MGRIILNEIGYGGLSGPAAGDRIYVDKILSEGTHIADLIVNDITTPLYAPPGAVNDVMVRTTGDYVSVLDSHGNGKVDLSDLYSNKQDKLTAGRNITITSNTISASKTNVSVTANYNSGVNLCSITIDGTTSDIYIPSSAIAGVSGVTLNGTSTVDPTTNIAEIIVEPNPNETATDSLTKLKISNTTYAVAATDEKVTQTETTTDADYELLFSETADDTTRTEGSRKSENLLYNPNDITLTIGATTGMTIDGDNGDINLIGGGDTWDGTYTSLKDAIAHAGGGGGTSDLDAVELTQAEYDALTPEQKVDEDKIYFIKDGGSSGGGGGGTNTVLLTKAEYDALTPAQKTNGTIYFVYATADPNYEYRVCKDGQIIVQRNKTTGDVTWWFIGYSNEGNDWAFPQDMQNHNWMPTSNLIYGVSYDSDKVTQNANIGVYNGYAREWSIDLASLVGYTTWGVVTNSGGTGQNNPWSDPPDTNTENAIYFMSKKFSSYDISS